MIFEKDTFYYQAIFLRASGIRRHSNYFAKFELTFVTAVCCLYVCIAMLRSGYENLNSVEELSQAAAPSIQCLISMWKCFIFWKNHAMLAKFITQLRELMDKAENEEKKILLQESRHDNYLSGFFCIMAFLAGIASLFAPAVVIIGKCIFGGEIEFYAPYKGVYTPADLDTLSHYIVVYIISSFSTTFVVNLTCIMDSFISWFVHNIVAQFRILHFKLEQANKLYENDALKLEADIIDCIRDHQQVIAIAEGISKIFEPIAFQQYALCAIQLCLIAYQFIAGVDNDQIPFIITFTVAVCMQMIIYSYNGDRLKTESENFAVGVYKAMQWQQSNTKCRKLLMLVMLRAQKPVILTGVFFDVNWRLFVEVIRTAASYVTLMKSMA